MKRTVCLLILVSLCLTALTPASAESGTEPVDALYAQVLSGEMPLLPGDAYPYGRLLIAVYEPGEDAAARLSCNEAEGEGYHGIPGDRLASGFSDAQTLILIYPEEVYANPVQTFVDTMVCVVDLIRGGRYESFQAARKSKLASPPIYRGPGLGTLGENRDNYMDVDKAMEWVLLRMEENAAAADESLYRQAEKHFDEQLYYTAQREFLQSLWGDWLERAAACELPWPENGAAWRAEQAAKADARLIIQIDQPEDSAFFARLYRDGKACVGLFVAGPGTASAEIPAGEYAIKAGSGSVWYGGREVFGPGAAYQYMTFDEDGCETVRFEAGYAYTLSISVETAEPGSGVGSEPESWENVVE